MIFQLPPAIVPAEVIGRVPVKTATVNAECKKNSRDCFPGDLVGVAPEAVIVLPARGYAPISALLTGAGVEG